MSFSLLLTLPVPLYHSVLSFLSVFEVRTQCSHLCHSVPLVCAESHAGTAVNANRINGLPIEELRLINTIFGSHVKDWIRLTVWPRLKRPVLNTRNEGIDRGFHSYPAAKVNEFPRPSADSP